MKKILSNIFVGIFYLLSLFFCLLEVITYPGMLQNKLGLNLASLVIFSSLLVFVLVKVFNNNFLKKELFLKFNKIFLIFNFLIWSIMTILERMNYPNFVFSTFHLNLTALLVLIYFLIFSWFLFNDTFQKIFNDLIKLLNKNEQEKNEKTEKYYLQKYFSKIKNNWFFLILLVILLYFSLSIPFFQDSWISANNSRDIDNYLAKVINETTNFLKNGGRYFFGSLIEYFLMRFPYLLKILDMLILVAIIYLPSKFFTYKNNLFAVILSGLMILSVSDGIKLTPYLYAGFGYITPVVLSILLIQGYKKLKDSEFNWFFGFCLFFLSFILSNWMEHNGFAIALILISYYLYKKFMKKQSDDYLLSMVVGGLSGFTLTVLWPSILATKQLPIINNVSLITSFLDKFVSLFKIIFLENKFLFSLFLFVTSATLIQKNKNNYSKYLVVIFAVITQLIFLLIYFFDKNNLYKEFNTLLMFFVFASINLAILFSSIISKNKKELLFFYFMAILSLIPIFPSTYLSHRTVSSSLLFFIVIISVLSSEIKWKNNGVKKSITILLITAFIFISSDWIFLANKTRKIEKERKEIIYSALNLQKRRMWNYDDDYVILPELETNMAWGSANPQYDSKKTSFYYPIFLKYYGLDLRTKVITEKDGFAYKNIDCNLHNNIAHIYVDIFPNDINNYEFKFTIFDNEKKLLESSSSSTSRYDFDGSSFFDTINGKISIKNISTGNESVFDCE